MATIKYLNENGEYEEVNTIKIVEECGGESGGGSQMEYWASSENYNISLTMAFYCPLIKGIIDGTMAIVPSSMIMVASNPVDTEVKAIAFDRSTMFLVDGEYGTLGDILSILGWDDSIFIQITKEEFYTI